MSRLRDAGGSDPQVKRSSKEVLIRCQPYVFLIYWGNFNLMLLHTAF